MNYYAALDVSLRSVHLCVIDDGGEIQAEGQVDSEAAAIDLFLRKLNLPITSIGLEAGTLPAQRLGPLLIVPDVWILELAQGEYAGCNDSHLADLLAEREGITISRQALRRLLRGAGRPRLLPLGRGRGLRRAPAAVDRQAGSGSGRRRRR